MSGRYSLDYDPEFEEMLLKLKTSKFHSSLIQDTANGDESGFDRQDGAVSSPSFNAINIDLTQEEISPHDKKIVFNKLRNHRTTTSQRQSMQVENVIIEIGENDVTDESSDSGNEEVDIDLNSTYSAKTMGNRRLSHMLDVLKEIECEEPAYDILENISNLCLNNLNDVKYNGYGDLSKPDYLSPYTPSPRTPNNISQPIPNRSYRLATISAYKQTPSSAQKINNPQKRPHESSVERDITRMK